jgi:RNA polymerase sigma-B factor
MLDVELSIRDFDGQAVVALRGELDLAGTRGAASHLIAAVAACGPSVIVDLAGLDGIAYSGLSLLLRVRKWAQRSGGDLSLAAPRQPVRQVLEATGLIDVFSVYPSVEQAPSGAKPLRSRSPARPRRLRAGVVARSCGCRPACRSARHPIVRPPRSGGTCRPRQMSADTWTDCRSHHVPNCSRHRRVLSLRAEASMAAVRSGTSAAAESVPDPSGITDRIPAEDLAGMDDQALLAIVGSLPRSSERRAAACGVLVGRYQGLIRFCVRRYLRGPEPAEDLMQVAYIGLLKAIGNFDPAISGSLGAYAEPCISGELKRHLRDKRLQVRISRPVQELALAVRKTTWQLAQELGRTPSEADLARHLGVSRDKLRYARRAELAFQPASLDAPLTGQPEMSTLADILGQEDPRLEHMIGMHAVAAHWHELPRREQQILLMDFRGGMTQAQIGRRLRISQMHVSRLRARALGHLRSRLFNQEEYASLPRHE